MVNFEIHLERCSNILDLKLVIDDYMDYYNNVRYQLRLAKLSLNQYSTYLKNDEYPIKI
ncbi:IS3 family transposase [Clostridium estertheticum]|uniref:IS3 family transposase n=1 Tax=Clostridium estertheticum TaxID=238834 RepID=UPI00355893F8